MKRAILALVLVLSALALPAGAYAQTTTVESGVCVGVYGGGVVCGAKHEIVDTDLGDISPVVLGAGFLVASGMLVYLSKRVKRNSSQVIG